MRVRRALAAVSMLALGVAWSAAPASAEGPPPPACPWNSWLAFDWPDNTYVQVDPKLPLGCFSNWCPEGYAIVSPYADGSDPFSFEPPDYLKPWVAVGPWARSGTGLSAAWEEGDVPPGCVLQSTSPIKPPPPPPPPPANGDAGAPGGEVGSNVITNPGAAPAPEPGVSALIPATPPVVAGTTVTNPTAGEAVAVAGTQLTGNLPRTGGETRPVVVGGVLLVAVGGALAVAARRRRTAQVVTPA